MERRTQRRVVRKSRKIRKNVFLLLTLALILCLGTFAMGAQKGRETKTYYESVEIQRGDTIWDIAKEYKAEGQKTEQMVDAICEVNGRKYHRTGDERNIKKGNAKGRREMKELHLPSVNGDNS